MFCRNCGEQMNEQQAVCIKCGVKTGEGNSFCPNCGKAVDPNADVCLGCGMAIKKPVSKSLGGQDKLTMALICFFLGAIGIHNFMMGENKKGIFKIIFCIFCGISGIFALIDFVKILTDKYEVNPEKLL